MTDRKCKFCKNGVYCFLALQSINKSYSADFLLNIVTSIFSTSEEDVEKKAKETKTKEEQKEEGFLDKLKKYTNMFLEFKKSPISFLNNQVYCKYECDCEEYPNLYAAKCKTDNKTGIHYKQLGNSKSKKYLFFFHGMLYDIHTFWEIEKKLAECDYNLVFVEYNSFKQGNDEVTYGFTQIKEMSDLIYTFICNFLEDKNPENVILCGHSHGNNYPIELLDRFISEKKYTDKLYYIGIKGYFRIEKALLHAIEALRGTEYKLFVDMLLPKKKDGSDPLDEEKLDIIRNLVGAENYYDIINNNDNEKKIQKIIDHLEISNTKLTGEKHEIELQDFNEAFDYFKKYAKQDNNKIPCLLFYSEKDEYVGDEFKTNIGEFTAEQIKEKERKEKEKIDAAKERDKEVQKALDEVFKKQNIKKEEIYKKPTGAFKAEKNEITQKPKKDQDQKQDQEQNQVPQTTDKKKYCEKYKK